MHRCYLAITGDDPAACARALEWLEETVGARCFARLPLTTTQLRVLGRDLHETLARLRSGEDAWLAELAGRVGAELLGEERLRPPVFTRRPGGESCPAPAALLPEASAMELIEKVFLLQQVDLLRGATAQQLALLGSIATEVAVEAGTVLLRRGEPTDAMHVVVDGSVELRGEGEQTIMAQHGTAFGTWALIDEAPSLVHARVVEAGRLLRITRGDFDDLIADHHELSLGLLRGLARRVRALAEP